MFVGVASPTPSSQAIIQTRRTCFQFVTVKVYVDPDSGVVIYHHETPSPGASTALVYRCVASLALRPSRARRHHRSTCRTLSKMHSNMPHAESINSETLRTQKLQSTFPGLMAHTLGRDSARCSLEAWPSCLRF